jgi:hypothetical protein
MLPLDWNNEDDKCFCKTHPCFLDQGGTVRHDCSDPAFPLLKYREVEESDGSVRTICECVAPLRPPRPKQASEEL